MKILIFLLLQLLFLNKIKSIQLIYEIDLNSNLNYTNWECGGSHDLVFNGTNSEYWYQNNTQYFPPCKSIADAGYRARQFYFRDIVYDNVSAVLEFINLDWKNKIIIDNIRYGDLKYYCGFEIRVKNEPNALITIDGSKITTEFIDYYIIDKENAPYTTCDSNYPTRISLKNINFINFKRNIVIYCYNYDIFQQTIQMEFKSINVVNTNVFIVSNPYYKNAQTIFKFEDCTFSNVKSTFLTTILYFNNPAIIKNCKFKNISMDFPLIVNEEGGLEISNVYFENINITNNGQVISSANKQIVANNLTISNSEISAFITFRVWKITTTGDGSPPYKFINKISNINFYNNTLYTSSKTSIYSKYTSLFNFGFDIVDFPGRYYSIDLSNISFDSFNNNGNTEKELLYTILVNNITINNVIVPNLFSNSIFSSNTNFEISNSSIFNSSPTFCKGSLNNFNFQIFKNQLSNDYLNFIEDSQSCNSCKFYYLSNDNSISTSSSSSDTSYNSSNESSSSSIDSYNHSSNSTIENKNENDSVSKFNKILIIPILLSGLILLIIIISVIFRKRIKQFIKKSNNSNNNGEVEDNGGVPLENLN